ncbi:DUF1427 family protein [Nguyenibacter sp. L1]|uniref:DUF1427 family protein n=1 Tax=Nguyenibacter sp. L1 TaxID=3049350 RepID=UPI002B4721D0|nr:DUF1427 family protein [Nguyenibacter sp. L1]WRH89177.1 DUF1427 family protein [Nguyenibacter sp. L1]
MKPYLVSLLAGTIVGLLYGLVNVRSPAPPIVALVGLLGILIGEQIVPVTKHFWLGQNVAAASRASAPDTVSMQPGSLPLGVKPRSEADRDRTTI